MAEQKPATTRTVVAKTPGIAVGASMIIPGFGQLYANAVALGVIFVIAWTIPFWLILFSFLIPGLTSLGQGAPLDVCHRRASHRGMFHWTRTRRSPPSPG